MIGAKRKNKWRFKIGVTEQVDVQSLLKRYPELRDEYKCNVWASAFLAEKAAYEFANKIYEKYPVDQSLDVSPIGGCQLRDIPMKTALKISNRIRKLGNQNNYTKWTKRRSN